MIPANDEKKRKNELRARSQKLRRKVLPFVIVALVLAVAIPLALTLLPGLGKKSPVKPPEVDEHFYAPYNGNIREAEEYLALDRTVNYCDDASGYGITQSLTDENREEFSAPVLFLADWLDTVIDGNADGYNDCFSAAYLKENGRQAEFAQQMIYGVRIFKYADGTDEKIGRFTTYRVEYMIRKNNGTFRRDVGSDAVRPIFVTLSTPENGNICITELVYYTETR